MSHFQPLTDVQWQLLEPLFPNPTKRTRGKPDSPWRIITISIFYILFTGSKWESLPKDPAFATKSASHRWFVLWDKSGFLKELLNAFQSIEPTAASIKLPSRR